MLRRGTVWFDVVRPEYMEHQKKKKSEQNSQVNDVRDRRHKADMNSLMCFRRYVLEFNAQAFSVF